jgi:signal peptidase I
VNQLLERPVSMNGTRVREPFGGADAMAVARPTTSWIRHPRLERILGPVVETALLAAVALAAFIGAGIVGNPWYSILRIDGGSMEPTFALGDLIVVMPAPDTIEPGMVLVLTVGGEVVTHRVVAVSADGTIVTRGDANSVNDAWGSRQVQVDGLYVATIPWLGHILPVGDASEASFADGAGATMQITVGSWPAPPTPSECEGMTFDEIIVGTSGDDTIKAGDGAALVFGLGGNDTIQGGNGKDCLDGGDGNDTLAGGNGKDVLLGGEGDDTIYGDGDGDVIQGGNGKDLLNGGAGTDACYGTDRDTFVGCESTSTGGSADPLGVPAPTPTQAPHASPTPDPEASPSPTPDPVATPPPRPTPAPTSTPTPPTATPDPTVEPPTVTFTFSVSGLTVSFRTHAIGADTWTWDFGDGTTSTKRNPNHTYATGGTYTVTLDAAGPGGTSASVSEDVTVAP